MIAKLHSLTVALNDDVSAEMAFLADANCIVIPVYIDGSVKATTFVDQDLVPLSFSYDNSTFQGAYYAAL